MKWLCTICNYVHEGEAPPDRCPVCGAGKDAFVPLVEKKPESPRDEPDTLEKVRDAARDRMRGLCAAYPWCDGAPGNICQREAYGGPIGMGGAGTGSGFHANVSALDRVKLEMRVVGERMAKVDTGWDFFGTRLSMPVMAASTSGIQGWGVMDEAEFNEAVVHGCVDAGTIGWRGDTHFYDVGSHGGIEAIRGAAGKGVQIFKPRENAVLMRLVGEALGAGCLAVGVDLDGFGSTNFARANKRLERKTAQEIRELVDSCGKVPFVCKGVMCPEDAEACVDAGARAIVVSNHGGRVLDGTPGVAEVVEGVADAVGGSGVLLGADGGVRTGYDVLRMLALGADFVLVGRDVVRAAVGGGQSGVRMQMARLAEVLGRAMTMVGCSKVSDIGRQVLSQA